MRHNLEKIVKAEPIQWHLKTSRFDFCPDCHARLFYQSQFVRNCPVCHQFYRLKTPIDEWSEKYEVDN
jgi:hypothetical protein